MGGGAWVGGRFRFGWSQVCFFSLPLPPVGPRLTSWSVSHSAVSGSAWVGSRLARASEEVAPQTCGCGASLWQGYRVLAESLPHGGPLKYPAVSTVDARYEIPR